MKTIVSKDGTTIAYEQSGQGPAVILVGGAFNSSSFGPNAGLAPILAEHFTVINYDRRGYGESGNTEPYDPAREIEDIETLIDMAGGSAYVYGISSGAALALKAANALPNKVTKLAIFEAPFVVDDTRTPLPADYIEHFKALIAEGKNAALVKYFMAKGVALPAAFVAMMPLMPGWPKLKAAAPTVLHDAQICIDNQRSKPLDAKQWAAITMPTLVIAGGKSPAWMKNANQALTSALPNATHQILEGQMHIVKPKAIAPVLIEFFEK